MPTLIQHIGSPWSRRNRVDTLLGEMQTHTLDPLFEEYGDFVDAVPTEIVTLINAGRTSVPNRKRLALDPERTVHVWGNFYDLSAVFSLYTDDDDLIATIRAAVAQNKATDAYKIAKQECKQQRAWWKAREAEQRKSLQTRRHGR